MSHRRLRRRSEKIRRNAAARPAEPRTEVVREATRVERLVYTRTQAAAALGVSRSTFDRRILPLIDTVEMPWGTRLVPADELERLIAEGGAPLNHPRSRHEEGGREVFRPISSTTSEATAKLDGPFARSPPTSTIGKSQRRMEAANGGRRPFGRSCFAPPADQI